MVGYTKLWKIRELIVEQTSIKGAFTDFGFKLCKEAQDMEFQFKINVLTQDPPILSWKRLKDKPLWYRNYEYTDEPPEPKRNDIYCYW